MAWHLLEYDRPNFRANFYNLFLEHVDFSNAVGIERVRYEIDQVSELLFATVSAIIELHALFVEAGKDDAQHAGIKVC